MRRLFRLGVIRLSARSLLPIPGIMAGFVLVFLFAMSRFVRLLVLLASFLCLVALSLSPFLRFPLLLFPLKLPDQPIGELGVRAGIGCMGIDGQGISIVFNGSVEANDRLGPVILFDEPYRFCVLAISQVVVDLRLQCLVVAGDGTREQRAGPRIFPFPKMCHPLIVVDFGLIRIACGCLFIAGDRPVQIARVERFVALSNEFREFLARRSTGLAGAHQ